MAGYESQQAQEDAEVIDEGLTPGMTRGIFRGWFLAAIGAVITVLGDTPFYACLPIWNPVLRNAFGWTSGHMSWAYATVQVRGVLFGPAEGLLIQKLGPRRAICIGLTIFGIGFLLFSQLQELWQLYTTFFILSMGSGLAALLPMQTVLNNWFVRYKIRAMSLQLEGLAIGGIVVPLLLAWSIGGIDPAISQRYGWSASAIFIGALIIVFAFPITCLVRNRPEDVGLRPDGNLGASVALSPVPAIITSSKREEGYTLGEAIKSRTFWLISFGRCSSNIVTTTVMVHLGLMLDDRGFSLQEISAVVAAYTGTSAVFILVGGYIGDRLPLRHVAFWFSAVLSLAVVVLVLAHNMEMLILFAVLLGMGRARMPVTSAMWGVYFGRSAFAAINGVSRVPMGICLFIAPLFAGLMRDTTGTYDTSFLAIASVSLLGSFLFLLLGDPKRPPRSSRDFHAVQ